MNNLLKMPILVRILITLGLLAVVLLSYTYRNGTVETAAPPTGAVSGLNTLLYVYADN